MAVEVAASTTPGPPDKGSTFRDAIVNGPERKYRIRANRLSHVQHKDVAVSADRKGLEHERNCAFACHWWYR